MHTLRRLLIGFITPALIISPFLSASTAYAADYAVLSTASSVNPVVGQTVAIASRVTNSGPELAGGIIDIEVYSANGQKAYQQYFSGQNIASGATRTFTAGWKPTAAGSYTIKVGIFRQNWSGILYWGDDTGKITVANPVPAIPAARSISVWWPTANASLSGTQPLKALVEGLNVSDYTMYWQVDGGQQNLMPTNTADYPHKEVTINLGGWNWRGQGPYVLTFSARNAAGTVIATKQIPIYVQNNYHTAENIQAPTPPTGGSSGQTGSPAPIGGVTPEPAPVPAPLPTPTPSPTPTPVPPANAQVIFNINSGQKRAPISPYIYGTNFGESPNSWDGLAHNLTFARFGGNRLTAYNWENNASHAGSDWLYQNDSYLGGGDTPGEAVRMRVDLAHKGNAATLITVPVQGYVAADKAGDGDVNKTPNYLSTRFRRSYAEKAGPLSASPDLFDNAVYQDEFVAWLENKFPYAKTDPTKKIFYSLDNEPDLWSHTHARIQPNPVTYQGLINQTVAFARGIKRVAPQGLVFGASNYGWNGFASLQNAPDANGRDFINTYLDAMRQAETQSGQRLLDVLDIHWYPEAQGGGRRITADDGDPEIAAARVQAPRSLWDPTYKENSWITAATGAPIALIPLMKNKIAAHYPGTKLAVTEYNYGGGAHISGGLAQADVLGIFGREGVFAANWWRIGATDDRFIYGAFDMFRNFDGQGGSFGAVSVSALTSRPDETSVYASTDAANGRLVVVAINKAASARTVGFSLSHAQPLKQAALYRLSASAAKPVPVGTMSVPSSQALAATLPAESVTTFVFTP
ncbi:MAG: hypothetical protein UY92_C0006G0119 [Candidatus Magasanikbacteria bacterium GW2011_GWA2_56_11]|uniref:Uncharacterized protein n=1 Tax=Candidatus Magasanikbacteria bacterium GW2011_GWA2_56_11 TaxID=1619044 RepID=A0A0G1YGJ0_9BACT|nr:MAG: hypothetical protein UY92_C0006G0119 [Candidatus Magasanikbacteria bacterium GW2011_GWA2_56_11]